jgi:hypothetical protein
VVLKLLDAFVQSKFTHSIRRIMVGFAGETVEVNHAGSGKVLDVR